MTLAQFALHRVPLYEKLLEFMNVEFLDEDVGWEVTPVYEDDLLFVAEAPGQRRLVCVSPRHSHFYGSCRTGVCGAWLFEDDLKGHPCTRDYYCNTCYPEDWTDDGRSE